MTDQQERMRQQAVQSAKERTEFKIAVGEKDKELEKAKKLVETGEQFSKAKESATRIQ